MINSGDFKAIVQWQGDTDNNEACLCDGDAEASSLSSSYDAWRAEGVYDVDADT